MSQRDTAETLAWFPGHDTAKELGYNPDGQCLKIARSARNIASKYPTALSAAIATPVGKRVKMEKLRPGMVVYYDNPHDDNPFGHVATVTAVAPIIKSFHDFIVETNSVKSGQLVKVRGDYFPNHWGDPFQYGATCLNGVDLILPGTPKPAAPPKIKPRAVRVEHAIADLKVAARIHRKAGHTRFANALDRDIATLEAQLKGYNG